MIDYKLPKMLSQASQNTSTEKATTAHFISEVALVSVIIPCYNHAPFLGQATQPEAAFVSGHYRYIQEDGSFLSQYPQEVIEDN